MTMANRMMGSGIAAGAAQNIQGDISSALTASGTTKANALALSSAINYITICSSGKAVSLPALALGDDVEIYNNGANSLLVFTQVGSTDSITNLTANAGYTLSVQKGAHFRKCTSTIVMVNKSS